MRELPPYATENNFNEAKEIVTKILVDKGVKCLTNDFLQDKTIELLSIIYAKGGGYTKDMYWAFGKAFFDKTRLLKELREKGEYNSKEEALEALIDLIYRCYDNNKAQELIKYAKEDGAKQVLYELDMDGHLKDINVKGICHWLI